MDSQFIVGKICEIQEAKQVTDTFKKRTFVLECVEKGLYTDYLPFDLVQDKCDVINEYQIGDDIEVSFNIRGRKWVDNEGVTRYFVTLQAWRIKRADSPIGDSHSSGPKLEHEEDEDLPF
jgi:hypothetical protein